MRIVEIMTLVGLIPQFLCVINCSEYMLFNEKTLDSFLQFIVLPQYGLYEFAEKTVRKSGIVVLMVLSTLIFWPYNIILLGLGIIYMIGYFGYKIFMKLFGKKDEDEE